MDTYLFPQPMVLSGPIVQLIQAPNGTTQLVSTSTSPGSNSTAAGNSGGQPVVSASSTKNSSVNSSRSTKQILPKPPGSGANSQSGGASGKSGSSVNNNGSGVNNSSANSNPNGNPGNQGARSLVTNMPSTVNTVGHTLTTGPLSTGPGQQILLGPHGNQKMSFLNQPGTFLLNQVIPGLGSQPILIQGNINNIGGPLQLTLRQQQPHHSPSVVAVSSANGNSVSVASSQGTTTTPLISALAGQTSNTLQRTTQTAPTYLFPNQGPNVSSAPTMMMASGQHNFRGQNIIFTRPQNLIGTPGSMVQGPGGTVGHSGPTQTVPQIIQIQTPNGPMFVALQTTPHLGPHNGGSQIIQTHVTPSPQAVPITSTIMPLQTQGTVSNQSASTHPTLHTILQTSSAESLNQSSMGQQQSGAPLTANNLIFSQSGNVISSQQSVTTSTSLTQQHHLHQNQLHHHQQQPKQSQTPHSSSTNGGRGKVKKESKGVNLADLLKETGILQDSSPPQSPSSITIRQTDTEMTNSISPQTEITHTSSLITGTTQTISDTNHYHHHHHHHHQTNQSQQQTMLMVPGQGSNQGSNFLIAQGHGIQPGTTPQLRLSLAPDGSVILQPTNMGTGVNTSNTHLQNPSNTSGTGTAIVSDLGSSTMGSISNSKFIDTLRDSCGPGSSQPSPDSTTPTLDASTPTSTGVAAISSTKSNSPAITTLGSSPVMSHKQTLMQHLNAGSTMKVGDSVTSMTITPIMGPPLRDDLKTGSSFIPMNITSELTVRDSLTLNNLKTTFKQEPSIKSSSSSSSSSADHSTSTTATTTTPSPSPLLSEVKTEIVTVPRNNIPTTSSSTSTSTTTSVLTMSNCDNLGQNASMPVLMTNASLIIPEDANNSKTSTTSIAHRGAILTSNQLTTNKINQSRNNTGSPLTSLVNQNGQSVVTPSSPAITGTSGGGIVTSSGAHQPTIVDQNGYQFVQISLNNQEFIERLESQIKKLTALKSPKDDQKQLLQELLSLQKKMSEGKNQQQNSISGESKIILTSQSPDQLLSSQPQQLQQQQQSTVTPTGQQQQKQLTSQRKTISSPGPQSLPQSIQAHLQQLFPDTQQETEQQSQPSPHTSMPSILPKITSTQQLTSNSQQLNKPHSPSPSTFNTLIKLNNSNSNSNSTTSGGVNQLHQITQSQIVTASPQQAQNVRILTPGNTTTSIDGNTTIQLGTQLITIAASPSTSKSSTLQSSPLHKQSSGGSNATTIQVVRIGTPNTSTSSTNSVNKYFKTPLESPQLESEKTKAKICRYFQQQAAADQSAAIRPDTKSPFKSRGDACKRLLRYHVFNTPVPSEEQLSKVDRDFEVISESLLKRKNELFNRFRYNLLKSNMIETPKAEYIMLNKWFINDENTSLQRDKDCVAQGKDLDLPPPPESWSKIIRDNLEEEERLSINRKRKSSAIEDDFLADCTEIKKYDLEDRESGDTDDDDEEDSDEEDDDEENTAAEDIAKYLGPNHHQDSVPDLGFYPDFNHTEMGLPPDVNSLTNTYTQRTNDNQDLLYNNEDWKSNNFMSTSSGSGRRFDGWGARYDNENDVAVTTILGGGENGETTDHDNDLDLSSIQDFHGLDKYSCPPPPPPASTSQRSSTTTHSGQPPPPPSSYGLENGGPDDQRQQHQSSSHHDDDEDDDDDEGVNEDEDDDEEDEDEDLTERTDDDALQLPCQLSGILDMPLPHQSPQSSQSYFNSIHSTSRSSGKSSSQQQQSTSSHSSPDTSTNYGQQQLSPQSTSSQQQSKSPLDPNQQSTSTPSTAYPNQMHPMMHQPNHPTSPRSNNMIGDFRNPNQMMSDPILDEAVRSILSWS